MNTDQPALVTKSYNSNYPNPISFRQGEVIKAGREDDEYPGWIWVTTPDANQGWAPIEYLEISESRAVALQDYTARELTVAVGEKVKIHYSLNGWCWGSNEATESGWVPLDHILA
ncbi:SH3 domain-containing protein [Endozoicomonadaceae bacterium StTr2]